ncbi:MAG: hypothetical protein M1838_004862 [Thelocarpon superellum]|nr:MAG: hypothetical protein M1838_004862 [Thelocarpon superellum]
MAFRQPTHQAPPRQTTSAGPVGFVPDVPRPVEESQEWVLFSPVASSATPTTLSTARTRTAGLSRFSHVGSLDTGAGQSESADGEGLAFSELHDRGLDLEAEALYEDDEDEEDLDSLDSHLHAFRAPSVDQPTPRDLGGLSVLPTHDGLGTFPASSPPVQEHLYQFEQFNPKRRRRRSSALRGVEHDLDGRAVDERTSRIQAWRMEQSRVLLDEIEKETRRRRMSRTTVGDHDVSIVRDRARAGGETTEPQEDQATAAAIPEVDETESFWKRLTRRVIRDLIGIDENILSVIFGETLVDEAEPTTTRSPAEDPGHYDLQASSPMTASWEERLLERLARELGSLVHQLAEHPATFSTYLRVQQAPEYVGRTTPTGTASLGASKTLSTVPAHTSDGPIFSPTIPQQSTDPTTHDAHWGIDETPLSAAGPSSRPRARSEAERLKLEREYWERELDASMVFSFLRNRFRRSNNHNIDDGHHAASPGAVATSSAESTAARAAMIRQQHPLTARQHRAASVSSPHAPAHAHAQAQAQTQRRARPSLYRPSSVAGSKRPSSSCASQGEFGRRTRGSGSSRHYWDLGTSVGSGSVQAGQATTGLGVWGEV